MFTSTGHFHVHTAASSATPPMVLFEPAAHHRCPIVAVMPDPLKHVVWNYSSVFALQSWQVLPAVQLAKHTLTEG